MIGFISRHPILSIMIVAFIINTFGGYDDDEDTDVDVEVAVEESVGAEIDEDDLAAEQETKKLEAAIQEDLKETEEEIRKEEGIYDPYGTIEDIYKLSKGD